MLLYHVIVFLPLISFLITGFGGSNVVPRTSELIACSFMVIVAIFSWIAFLYVAFYNTDTLHIPVMCWISVEDLKINWSFRIDTLTVVMLVVVNSISALVHIYSIGYMHCDPCRPRFFAYLSLFTFMMLMLVTSDNLIQMFFGWEGVGLVSYLLIGFWYRRPSANRAAMKAFIINRVGDFGLLLGIFSVFVLFGTVNFDDVFSKSLSGEFSASLYYFSKEITQENALTVVCLLLFMGAMGKSAQFFLHVWLPDAMEGPTPVSALIHAATMVTAGVFMVARMSPLFELASTALVVITIIGATTAFFAATIGLVQNDIKRVIAYSTCSQLGYMFVALGVGAYGAGIFHLFTHAFFKALLFLGAGSVIHASGEQDMRCMGGLRKYLPKTYLMMIVATFSLTGVGIPGTAFGTAGYFSKDFIIESAFALASPSARYAFWLLMIAAFFTSFYSWRLIFMTFHGKLCATKTEEDIMRHMHESPPTMLIPMLFLCFGALFAGALFHPYFFGHSYQDFWNGALFTSESNNIVHAAHHVPLWVKWSPLIVMICGFFLAFVFYVAMPAIPKVLVSVFPGTHNFLLNKWYFDELYTILFVHTAFVVGRVFWKIGDVKIIDGFGPNGIAEKVIDVSNRIIRTQTGYLYHYAFAILIGVVAFVTWMMIRSLS